MKVTEQAGGGMPGVYGNDAADSILRSMEVGVSKHLLNDSFTILWGNSAFYKF